MDTLTKKLMADQLYVLALKLGRAENMNKADATKVMESVKIGLFTLAKALRES